MPGALSLYPKALLPDWAQRKSSIVFDCDDVHAAVARMKVRRDVLAGADDDAVGARSRPFDSEGDEHGLRGRSEIAQAQKPPTA